MVVEELYVWGNKGALCAQHIEKCPHIPTCTGQCGALGKWKSRIYPITCHTRNECTVGKFLMSNEQINIVKLELREKSPEEVGRKSRIYIFISDETILDNLKNRHFRPHLLYRQLFPEIQKSLNLQSPIRANWKQSAGCSCGCSPGFVVRETLSELINKDLFVTVTIK